MITLLTILSALLLELAGGFALLGSPPVIVVPGRAYLGLHLAASLLAALGLYRLLPGPYRRPGASAHLALFALAFFVPLLGLPALLLALLAGLRLPKRHAPPPCETVAIPELPYRPLNVSEQPRFGQGGLAAVLRNAPDVDRRVHAVLATRQLRDQDAIPILRIALRDPEDDVRLLAYSLLDAKEHRINERIHRLATELQQATMARKGPLHLQLGNQYWELAYLGLATSDVRTHALEQALAHLEAAAKALGEEIGLLFQKGRVLLRLGRLQEAAAALERARELGMSEMDVNPYLAEVAYAQRDWPRVRRLLSTLDPLARAEPPLSLVAEYWGAPS